MGEKSRRAVTRKLHINQEPTQKKKTKKLPEIITVKKTQRGKEERYR